MGLVSIIRSLIHFSLGFSAVIFFNTQLSKDASIPLSGFASKTAYRHCGLKSFEDQNLRRLSSCQLVHISALFRHGTRAPSQKDIGKFRNLHDRLLLSKDAILPSGFSTHPVPFEHIEEKTLLPRGYLEHRSLGRLFRDLLSPSFINSKFKFYASSVQRAIASALSFHNGFFDLPPLTPTVTGKCDGKDDPTCTSFASVSPITVADHLIRFFDYCKRYVDEIEQNKSFFLSEYAVFRNGPEMQRVYRDLLARRRLENDRFTTDDLYTVFLACAYETASSMDDKTTFSPWCDFLHLEEVPVLEYMVDLKQYWLKSYGYELNYLQSCPLVSTIIGHLQEAAHSFLSSGFDLSDPQLIRGSFWFGHAESLLPVVAALGLFNDSVGHAEPQHLRALDYSKWLSKAFADPSLANMFRSGHISPFAGNLELRLYHCPGSVSTNHWSDGFFVQPLVNGRSVAWPLLSTSSVGSTIQPLASVLGYFKMCSPPVYNDSVVCTSN